MQVALVACGRAKQATPAQAQHMYNSREWVNVWTVATMTTDVQFIMSAQHGLLKPTDVIEPYNYALADVGRSTRRAWATDLCAALAHALPKGTQHVHVHAPAAYYAYGLSDWLTTNNYPHTTHAQGLKRGWRRSYYLALARHVTQLALLETP